MKIIKISRDSTQMISETNSKVVKYFNSNIKTRVITSVPASTYTFTAI